jgi:hypothetical protein
VFVEDRVGSKCQWSRVCHISKAQNCDTWTSEILLYFEKVIGGFSANTVEPIFYTF